MVTRVSTWTITVLTVDDVKATYQEDKNNVGILNIKRIKRETNCQ